MKAYIFIVCISILSLLACNKSASPLTPSPGNWQLIKKISSIGGSSYAFPPAADSSVSLYLDDNNGYVSELNDKIVCRGSYSITTDTSYNSIQVLQLNNFITTGIFNLFPIEEIGANGQVLSIYDGMFIDIHADTLYLSSLPTPGGYIEYYFIRKG